MLMFITPSALLFPETAGKTLEDTAHMFEDPNGIPYIGTPPWKTHVEYSSMSEIEQGNVNPDKLGSIQHDEEHSPAPGQKV